MLHTQARPQAVAVHRSRVDIAIRVVQLVEQDQTQRQQTGLRQQQGVDQIRVGGRHADDHHTQGVAPHVGDGVADPAAAQGGFAVVAVAGIVGNQRQPRHGHGDHQVHGRQHAFLAGAGAVPKRRPALGLQQADKLVAQPQQRQHHQGQAEAADKAAHQAQHRAGGQQGEHGAPQQGGGQCCAPPTVAKHGQGAVAHHHQFKRGPTHQLQDVEQHRQAGEGAAIHLVHQSRAGQTGVASDLGHPTQQACAQHRAEHDGQQGVLGADGGHQVSAQLNHQQAHAQGEPKGGVAVPAEDALIGTDGCQGFVV